MKDQHTLTRKRLSLGVNAIGVIDTILNWKKLESCFGNGFKFSDEAKHEITHELAVQQVRLHELETKDKPSEILAIRESARKFLESLQVINQSGNSKIVTELIDMVSEKAGINFTQLENAIKALEVIETKASAPRPNDLYRDIIRKLVAILEIDEIPLALHVQSSLNKFMTELDKQMPETIFPASKANYIQEGRVRILKDYLRGYLRVKS